MILTPAWISLAGWDGQTFTPFRRNLMDFKDRQAGEKEEEDLKLDPFMTALKNKADKLNSVHGHSLEFLEGAADWICHQTKTIQNDKERAQLLIKLSSYPKWRLLEIDKFSGYFAEVFKYLDSLQYKEPATELPPGLPEPPTTLAKDCLQYVGRLFDDKLDSKAKDKIEVTFVNKMRKKYPNQTWMCGRKGNKAL